MSGLEHNRAVAFSRIWSAVGAHMTAESHAHDHYRTVSQLYAQFEMRRYAAACYAFATTVAASER